MTRDVVPSSGFDSLSMELAPVVVHIQRNLAEQWIIWLDKQVRVGQLAELTRDAYRSKIGYWLTFLETRARTDKPTPVTVADYVVAVIETGHEPATTNFYLNTVKSFYRWCETQDFYPAIARSLRPIREFRDGPLPALSHKQIVQLIGQIPENTVANLRDRSMISLLYAAAFRTVSIVRADIQDFDFSRNIIMHQPKGHNAKDAAAILPPSVTELINRYLAYRKKEIGIPVSSNPQPMFIALDRRCIGDRITTRSVRGRVLHFMEQVGFVDRRDGKLVNPGVFSAHSIRHDSRCGRPGSCPGVIGACVHRNNAQCLCESGARSTTTGKRKALRPALTSGACFSRP